MLGVSEALCRLLSQQLTPNAMPLSWREVLDERVLPLGLLWEILPTFMWWERSPGPRAVDVHEFVSLVCGRLRMDAREVVMAYVLVEQIVYNCMRVERGLLRNYTMRKLFIGACTLCAAPPSHPHTPRPHGPRRLRHPHPRPHPRTAACRVVKVVTDRYSVSLIECHAALTAGRLLGQLTVDDLREIEGLVLVLLRYKIPSGRVHQTYAHALFAAASEINGEAHEPPVMLRPFGGEGGGPS